MYKANNHDMKTYVLDTNVLLSDPNCIRKFDDNDVVIPILTLEELDRLKTRSDEVGQTSREVVRLLDSFGEGLHKGVLMPGGGRLTVQSISDCGDRSSSLPGVPQEMKDHTSVDNMIIEFVDALIKHTKKTSSTPREVVLVSNDINVRVKCSSIGIPAQKYRAERSSAGLSDLYTGVKVVNDVNRLLIDDLYDGVEVEAASLYSDPMPNQIVVLKTGDDDTTVSSVLARVHATPDGKLLRPLRKNDGAFGVKPKNKEQGFSFELLMDPAVSIVTLTGRAGCGKTLLALAAGLEQLETIGARSTYQKLIVSRPIQPVGKDIGFLPGTLEEKMEPWIAPIRDNLEFLLSGKKGPKKKPMGNGESTSSFRDPYLDLMQQKGIIEVEAISFIRGRSIPNSFIIIDEAQNLSRHELKTIVTRAGEGSKIVLTGDIEQIDNVHVDSFTNGLTYAIEKFKDYSISGHVTLLKGERSALASLAASIL